MFRALISLKTYSSQMCNASVEFQIKIRKISRRHSRPLEYAELSHFTLMFCRGRHRKRTKIYNGCAHALFCSLNL